MPTSITGHLWYLVPEPGDGGPPPRATTPDLEDQVWQAPRGNSFVSKLKRARQYFDVGRSLTRNVRARYAPSIGYSGAAGAVVAAAHSMRRARASRRGGRRYGRPRVRRNSWRRGGNSIRAGRRVKTKTRVKRKPRVSPYFRKQVKAVIRGDIETKVLPLGSAQPGDAEYPLNVPSSYFEAKAIQNTAQNPGFPTVSSCSWLRFTLGQMHPTWDTPNSYPPNPIADARVFDYDKYEPVVGTGPRDMTGKEIFWDRLKLRMNVSLPEQQKPLGSSIVESNMEFRYLVIAPTKAWLSLLQGASSQNPPLPIPSPENYLFLNDVGTACGPANLPCGATPNYIESQSYAVDCFNRPVMRKFFKVRLDRKFSMAWNDAANKGNMKEIDHTFNIKKKWNTESNKQQPAAGVGASLHGTRLPSEWHFVFARHIGGFNNQKIANAPIFGMQVSGNVTFKDV